MNSAVQTVTALALGLLAVSTARSGVADTVHNLSALGPGTFKSDSTQELCIFCHTPHRAGTTQALWNRNVPPATYTIYSSSTLQSTPGQPSGSSRLCLSCHDGTVALGELRVDPSEGPAGMGPLSGPAAMGTDLSDSHPVSFVYDAALAQARGDLADPSTVAAALPLDRQGRLQCSTCHDPHSDRFRQFLRVDDRAGDLCTRCHRPPDWAGSKHASSQATWNGSGTEPWSGSPYGTVADNGYGNCHRPHSPPGPMQRLLRQPVEKDNCLVCHGGNVALKDISAQLGKPSAHAVGATSWLHDPREDFGTMSRHVTCADCHNAHEVTSATAIAPATSGRLKGVTGLDISGNPVREASYEYEICLKCHGLTDQTTPTLVRQDNNRNVRLEIDPGNPGFHPFATTGKNASVGGFEPGWSTASIVYCTDCHDDDEASPAPRGPHGSRYAPILESNYEMRDPSVESYQGYALCYKCHNRSFLIGDQAQTFRHQSHVENDGAPCSACHDAHGSRSNPHLINFMLRDPTGREVVSPSVGSGRLEYTSLGMGHGRCYLTCHGRDHNPAEY